MAYILLFFAPLAKAQPKDILILGDSLSAAYGLPLAKSWPHLLQQRLQQQGALYHIRNASISGETTRGGLTRLPALLRANPPAIVIVELGANDALRGISPQTMQANLEKILTLIEQAGAQILLVGIRLPPNFGPTFSQRFRSIFHELAQTHQAAYLSLFLEGVATQAGMMQEDGLHPNVKAQAVLLDNLWGVLAPMLGPLR